MPASIIPSLRAAFERLKHGGSVSGACLGWRRQLLLNLTPYEDFRAEKLIGAILDARAHFATTERSVETFWFGFDGVFVLGTCYRDCTLVLLHTRAHEVDFLKSASRTMLEDAQLLIQSLLHPGDEVADGGDTQPLVDEDDSGQSTNWIPRA
ncbi:MAG: hypothetical protein KDK99_18760 [Verrucomicrobiales bacterium]|nr:hypothetical protein [Verrucomicrobiales bacterium]